MLRIHDTSRTLSKVHARLDLVNDEWIITDLNSTNGVIVVASDGTERLLVVGDAAPVPFSFILGKLVDDDLLQGRARVSALTVAGVNCRLQRAPIAGSDG